VTQMAYKLSAVDKLELESMKRAMNPPCSANRDATLTAANIANIEAIRNGGVPVAVALPDTMQRGNGKREYMQQLFGSANNDALVDW